jgi:RimJ/RimL family protein N-acetyltransferase
MNTESLFLLPDRIDAGLFELHRATPEYLDKILNAVAESLDELRPWMTWAQSMPAKEAMRTVMSEANLKFNVERDWLYLLVDKGSSKILGGAGLHGRIGPRGLEIGYWVRTSCTGRGYATQTAKVLTGTAFTNLDWVERIEIHMDEANVASVAVPRKLGFTLVREEDRPKVTPGHSGRGYVWALERATWEERLGDEDGESS